LSSVWFNAARSSYIEFLSDTLMAAELSLQTCQVANNTRRENICNLPIPRPNFINANAKNRCTRNKQMHTQQTDAQQF
jgi:hypothetical protein